MTLEDLLPGRDLNTLVTGEEISFKLKPVTKGGPARFDVGSSTFMAAFRYHTVGYISEIRRFNSGQPRKIVIALFAKETDEQNGATVTIMWNGLAIFYEGLNKDRERVTHSIESHQFELYTPTAEELGLAQRLMQNVRYATESATDKLVKAAFALVEESHTAELPNVLLIKEAHDILERYAKEAAEGKISW